MLPASFAPLASVEPKLGTVYQTLDLWLERHSDWKWLVPAIVAQDYPSLDAFELAEALSFAVRFGFLRVEYTVLTPSGVLADESFDNPTAIPGEIADRQENYFDTRSLPVIPVYMLPEADAMRKKAQRSSRGC